MKSASKKRTPSIVNLTVKRRYLTEREVERLMDCARKHGRYGHRDATMILVAYRHGLRRPPEHPAYGPVHRNGAGPLQEFLALTGDGKLGTASPSISFAL